MVICLERGAYLHMAQMMPLPLTVSFFCKIQTGFTFLALAHLGSPRQRVVKRVCVCVLVTKQVKCQTIAKFNFGVKTRHAHTKLHLVIANCYK